MRAWRRERDKLDGPQRGTRLFTRMRPMDYCDGIKQPDADQFKSLLIFNIRHNYYLAKVLPRVITTGAEHERIWPKSRS